MTHCVSSFSRSPLFYESLLISSIYAYMYTRKAVATELLAGLVLEYAAVVDLETTRKASLIVFARFYSISYFHAHL